LFKIVGIEVSQTDIAMQVDAQEASMLEIDINSRIDFNSHVQTGEDIRTTRNLQFGIQVGYYWMIEQRYRGRWR
jgi:hypothetical protein